MDDAALVRASCEGDKEAFAGIYDRYSDRLFSFLCTVVRTRDDAADLLQDTFLTAGARLHQLRDPSKLRPWLYAIARNLAMKSLSRSGKQRPLDDVDIADTAAGHSEAAPRSEPAVLIALAAQGLGTQDRVVLDLHLRQGLEGQELGEALGVSSSHANVLLNRMLEEVERALGAPPVARQGSEDGNKLTAVLPLLPAPAHARAAVLDKAPLAGHSGRLWPHRNGGFPPPMARRRKPILIAAMIAILVLLVVVPTVALLGDAPLVRGVSEEPTPPEYPLEFPTDVFKPPEPLPEQFQPIEVPEPMEPTEN